MFTLNLPLPVDVDIDTRGADEGKMNTIVAAVAARPERASDTTTIKVDDVPADFAGADSVSTGLIHAADLAAKEQAELKDGAD